MADSKAAQVALYFQQADGTFSETDPERNERSSSGDSWRLPVQSSARSADFL